MGLGQPTFSNLPSNPLWRIEGLPQRAGIVAASRGQRKIRFSFLLASLKFLLIGLNALNTGILVFSPPKNSLNFEDLW